MGMNRIASIILLGLLLAGCQTSVATYRTYPVYGAPVAVYDGPPMVYRRPLMVPHREWIGGRCWIERRQRWDGLWIDMRRCM